MKKVEIKIIGTLMCITMAFAFAACSNSAPAESSAAKSTAQTTATISSSVAAGSSSTAVNTNASGNKVYFAGPLFSQSERDYNLKITKILEDNGYQVFLPQRDGFLATEMEGKTEEEKRKMIFEKDAGEVKKADIVFMNLDGRVPDEGACVELGIAYAEGKRCYGFKTDSRVVEKDLDLNPMISECFVKLFENTDGEKLIKELEEYLEENKL